ncbi:MULTISPECIES: hypothetical protein [Rhizobium]|uniref:Integrase n=1 Tax=Rhizobium leguminosarum bv. viciae TaxID=387 RepID=A0A8G2IVU5_RHILV|nr:hypothetical protein [Rhizobium leguminosarum]NKK11428.1 hypothetical protein [Rhizobium leguminosarum bv. viciae]NKK25387.1 hypothetical protein [Rhizobium leguminosarum bv. viciae]TBX89047.1 hypothetical protein E0H31_25570 [Rhizobium leguminosarum bv. viciae]TBZ13987.1 hypothetical protein E0H52_25250 [Rhizobium leguminosarum bv. viciae]
MQLNEQRVWYAACSLQVEVTPPYDDMLQVTPSSGMSEGSFFHQNGWYFPPENIPAGRKAKDGVYFLSPCFYSNNVTGYLLPRSFLLRQLKEVGVVHLFRTEVIKDTRVVPTAGFFYQHMSKMKRFFVAMKIIGLQSLSELTPFNLNDVQKLMHGLKAREFAFILTKLVKISRAGLVTDGLKNYDWEVDVDDDNGNDTTQERGAQPLTDVQAGALLTLSRTYISLAGEIAAEIVRLTDKSPKQRIISDDLLQKLPLIAENLPSNKHETTLHLLVEISVAHLSCYHFGFRPSELLSIREGFILSAGDNVELQEHRIKFVRTKNVPAPTVRELRVDPYLLDVHTALQNVRKALGAKNDFLFAHPDAEWEHSTNLLLYRLRRFSQLHRQDFAVTGYTWRKTVVEMMVRIITEAVPILAHVLGHQSESEAVGYALSNPQLRPEIQAAVMQVYIQRAGTLFETATSKSSALGGRAGKRLQQLLSADINSEELGFTEAEFVEDAITRGNLPVKVAPGVFCVRGNLGRGLCSMNSGDLMADPANCSAACEFQVQMPERKQVVRDNIVYLEQYLRSKTPSRMQKRHAVNQINEQLAAWPELTEVRDDMLQRLPQLRKWFAQ